jgi:hypothetical protein
MSQIPEEMFDVRKLERFVQEGLLTREQVDTWLSGLEDSAANSEQSSIQMVAHDRNRRILIAEEGGQEEDEG